MKTNFQMFLFSRTRSTALTRTQLELWHTHINLKQSQKNIIQTTNHQDDEIRLFVFQQLTDCCITPVRVSFVSRWKSIFHTKAIIILLSFSFSFFNFVIIFFFLSFHFVSYYWLMTFGVISEWVHSSWTHKFGSIAMRARASYSRFDSNFSKFIFNDFQIN